ncbi:MAG TPA: hypothetical protein VGM05_31240 [Planctomycetaceae bacterium]|jgi:hypothetical protein
MKIHAHLLVVAAAGCLLIANPVQAQDHPGYITRAPGPQLTPPTTDAGPTPDLEPVPDSQPLPSAGPMPAPGQMPYGQPMPAPGQMPYGQPMAVPGQMPFGQPMPGYGMMPNAQQPTPCCGQTPNMAPLPNGGPLPYGMPGSNRGPMPTPVAAAGAQLPPGAFPYVPPRIIHYGWPGIRIYRRDVPMPQPKPDDSNRAATKFVHPRAARLEIRTVPPARIYVDGEELDCIDGVYMVEAPKPLIPGVNYMHSVRVEGFDPQGKEIARTVVVYLRKGRVTELTFY